MIKNVEEKKSNVILQSSFTLNILTESEREREREREKERREVSTKKVSFLKAKNRFQIMQQKMEIFTRKRGWHKKHLKIQKF